MLLRLAWGVATFWSHSVSSLGIGTFLVFFLGVVSCMPLAQLLFQIVVLLSEAFHGHGEGLYLSLKGRRVWFVSLNVISGRYRSSKYHATLCLGSVCCDLQIYYEVASHRRRQLMMSKKSPVSHTVLARSKQHLHNKKRRPRREHQCGAGQTPSEGQVRTSHNSKVLERGQLCVPWFVRVLGLL